MKLEIPQRKHRHVDLTPLVDIMFNMLLFFVLTYQVSKYSEIKINLPKTNINNKITNGIDILITNKKEIYINNKKITLSEVTKSLSVFDKNKNINIRADKKLDIDFVVKFLAITNEMGFNNFSIITEKE